MEDNLVRIHSRTGNAIPSRLRAIGPALASQLRSPRRSRIATAAVAAALVAVLWAGGGPAAAGLGLIALTALVTAFQLPYLLGPFVALLLPASDAVHVFGAQVSPLEAVVGGGAIGYVALLASRREDLRLRVVDWAFLAFVFFVALSVLGPADNSEQFRGLLYWGALALVFHAVAEHFDKRRDLTALLVALATAAIVESSLALFEYLDRWSDRFSILGGAIVYPLPKGTLGHSNALAQFLVLAVLTVLALTLAERGKLRTLGFATVGVAMLALVVTFSRASWIALAVGMSAYLLDRRTRIPVLVAWAMAAVAATTTAVVGAGAIGARVSSLFSGNSADLYDFRLELIDRAARIIGDHPLTGSGHFEEVGVYAGRPDVATHPHNLFLGIAVFFGIPAALAFAGIVLLAFRAAWRGYRSGLDERRLTAVGFVAVLVALLVNGILEYPFWNSSLSALVVLVLAAATALEPKGPIPIAETSARP